RGSATDEARREVSPDREPHGHDMEIEAADGPLFRGSAHRYPGEPPGLPARRPHGADDPQGLLPDQGVRLRGQGRMGPGGAGEAQGLAAQIVFSTIARSSGVTSGSIPNHAFHAGRPWLSSIPRPLMVGLPRARAAARNGVSSGM